MRSFMVRLVLVVPVLAAMAGCSGTINDLPTTPDPVITTDTFTGELNINGAQTHFVFLSATGEVTATLTSLGENAPSKIGFSLGTLGASGNCTAVITNDTAIVNTVLRGTVQNLGGSLCARVYDVGALTEKVPYTFTVSHP
jgi:hypothetical protein